MEWMWGETFRNLINLEAIESFEIEEAEDEEDETCDIFCHFKSGKTLQIYQAQNLEDAKNFLDNLARNTSVFYPF